MIKIPDEVLRGLNCSICNGYLSTKPVVVRNERQICGKCYRILPQNEQRDCFRQISFETVAGCLMFPCRYHKMGCDHTFPWDTGEQHESECLKRYFNFPDVVTTLDDSHYETLDGNHRSGSNATLQTDLSDDQSLLHLPLYENVYQRLTPALKVNLKHCSNCRGVIKDQEHSCSLGHAICAKCKGEACLSCAAKVDGSARVSCRNTSRGCRVKLQLGDVAAHRDNCEYNLVPCPFEKCAAKQVLDAMKRHLVETHPREVHESAEVTKTMMAVDQTFVLLCHGGAFKVAYYYYVTNVELSVTYLGPCDQAAGYHFEVSVEANDKVTRRKRPCANWNDCMLAGGVSFDKKELVNNRERRFNFALNLRILRVK